MSSKNHVNAVGRRVYRDSYRFIRSYMNGYPAYAPEYLLQMHPNVVAWFISALVSFNNRNTEFGGWVNPYRSHHFWYGRSAVDYRGDIPF